MKKIRSLLGLALVLTALESPAMEPSGEPAGADSSGAAPAAADLDAEYRKLLKIVEEQRRPVRSMERELDISASPAVGSPDAAVVLVEFGDYQCPFCRRHLEQAGQRLHAEWVQKGRLLYVFEDFPVEGKHPFASAAAEAARCADDQGRYWEMRNVLYGAQKALHRELLHAHARSAGLDESRFVRCLDSGRHSEPVARSRQLGRSLGVRGTPSFFLGLNRGGGRVEVTRRITGAVEYDTFEREIRDLLAAAATAAEDVTELDPGRRMPQPETGIQ
jgi:protein-disulfide isomerase